MECIKENCGEELYPIKGLKTEPEGVREDQYCAQCNTRYRLHKSGLSIVCENTNQSNVMARNRELETTIKIMLELKK